MTSFAIINIYFLLRMLNYIQFYSREPIHIHLAINVILFICILAFGKVSVPSFKKTIYHLKKKKKKTIYNTEKKKKKVFKRFLIKCIFLSLIVQNCTTRTVDNCEAEPL